VRQAHAIATEFLVYRAFLHAKNQLPQSPDGLRLGTAPVASWANGEGFGASWRLRRALRFCRLPRTSLYLRRAAKTAAASTTKLLDL
jgi:hypothetical protein